MARPRHATPGKLLAEDGPYELHLKERGLVNVKTALSSLRRGLKAHMATDVAILSRNDIDTSGASRGPIPRHRTIDHPATSLGPR